MNKYGLNELREQFLSFFEEKGHLRLQSFPLIPQNDASLLLINSGMAPMKPWFTGEQEPPRKRVCTCQKCIRTGDIDNVGKTERHGTYFEMLGNFSFGDYFKHEAIAWCWEFLTDRLGLDPELLYPSVYLEDDESFDIWNKEIGVAKERITRLGKADNFWEHGSGPCGPCSEVYFDRGAARGCGKPGCAPGCDCDRYVEVWNNVFTQFNNDGNNNYTELSQKNIDTGMGLERLAVVCQGVNNLFEVDTVMSILRRVSEITGAKYGSDAKNDVSVRVITDHIRSATMMICDGVIPSNEGRGYVLRRLLRRAARHGKLLGVSGTFLHELCKTVIGENRSAYPDLVDKEGYITRVISTEEENFNKTIDAGMSILTGLIEEYKAKSETTLSGADAFKLYDTYGFPLDLTVEILSEHGLTVDDASFNEHMKGQRERARAARAALGDLAWAGADLGLDIPPTVFTGYESTCGEGKIAAIIAQGEQCGTIGEGQEGILVLDISPFYAERGGQTYDFGSITVMSPSLEEIAVFTVDGVQLSRTGQYLHHGKMRSNSLSVGDTVQSMVNTERRAAVSRAHSATHLLHKALRDVLGDHVQQAGSLVEPDKLRFDFTHFSAMTDEELRAVERKVNDAALSGHPVTIKEMPIDEARKLGATALFGEKYGDTVRVVTMGKSVELCGGTHLDNTAKAGAFSITAEFSVASGVRRIEATTGVETLERMAAARSQISALGAVLKANAPEEIFGKLEQNMAMLRELRGKLDIAAAKEIRGEASRILANAREIGGLKVITTIVEDVNIDADKLRQMEDMLRDWESAVVAVLAVVKDGKITIAAACGKAAVEKGVKAGDIIREVTKLCGGSGGGKPDFAMGGGKDESKLASALEAVDGVVKAKLGI